MFTPEQIALHLSQASNEKCGVLRLFEVNYIYGGEAVQNVEETRYSIRLVSYSKHYGCGQYCEREWLDLRLLQITGRWWYFRRVAAKMQLDEPKKIFEFVISRTVSKANQKAYMEKKRLDKFRAAKAKLTKIQNRIQIAEKEWDFLFPITDDPLYQKAKVSLFAQRALVAQMEEELKSNTWQQQP